MEYRKQQPLTPARFFGRAFLGVTCILTAAMPALSFADGTLDQQALEEVAINTPRPIAQPDLSQGKPVVPGHEVPDGFGSSKFWSSAGAVGGQGSPPAPPAPAAPIAAVAPLAASPLPQLGNIGILVDERRR